MNLQLTATEIDIIEDLLCGKLKSIIQYGEEKNLKDKVDTINNILVKINENREKD